MKDKIPGKGRVDTSKCHDTGTSENGVESMRKDNFLEWLKLEKPFPQ